MDPVLGAALISAAGAIAAAVAGALARRDAQQTRHQLENGTSHALQRIEARQGTQDKRMERIESKVDRAHARLNDHIELAEKRYREVLSWGRDDDPP